VILQRLAEHYDRIVASGAAKLAPPGYSLQKVSFCIVLEVDGRLNGFEDMRRQEGKQPRPQTLIVPGQSKPPGSGFSPRFLWDNAGYLLGFALDAAKAERAPKEFASFRDAHLAQESAIAHPAFSAVCSFLRGWYPERCEQHAEALMEFATSFGVFRLVGESRFVHDMVGMREPEAAGDENETPSATCLITGEYAPLARLHEPKIKGVAGAQTSGALIVSFNASAFTSYGKEQSFNAPVSLAAAFKYTNALNHLLADRTRRTGLGDTTVVYWADQESRVSAATLDLLSMLVGTVVTEADAPAAPTEDQRRLEEARQLLSQLRSGAANIAMEPDDIPTRFFILGLSPNASRLSIRLWVEGDATTVQQNLGAHIRDLALTDTRNDRQLAVWNLVTATGRADHDPGGRVKYDTKHVSPQLAGDLLRSVLTGAPYPQSLLATMIRRIRSDGEVALARVSAIKAVLVRNSRPRGAPMEVPLQLDPLLPDPAYRCGQLFALLEKAQSDSLGGDLNSTIKDRYFSSASATPALVFPRLFRLNNHHLAKLSHGNKIYYQRLMASALREPFSFPRQLSLEQQGMFIVGYFQQQRDLYTKKDKPAPEEPPADEPTHD
jgi:CRISPR-associated protein Csd1